MPFGQFEATYTDELYPGRPQVRPRITFKNVSRGDDRGKECAKDCFHAPSHSPELFTLQFSCQHFEILRVTVMSRIESYCAALTSTLSRFPVFRPYTLYDSACNLVSNVNLRVPWVKNGNLVLV